MIPEAIEKVREKFLSADLHLLEGRVHERTVTSRISIYLQALFPEWHVDCEYNRHGVGADPKLDSAGRRRFPDIIIHKRGTDKNLVVIEAKPAWAPVHLKEMDREKIQRIIERFNYKHAYLLTYRTNPADLKFEKIK